MNNCVFWIVAKLKPGKDQQALLNLEKQGFQAFQPKLKTVSKAKNKFREIITPVFPGYVFIGINKQERNWRCINNTRGISKIIVFGKRIPVIQNEVIEELKYRFLLNEHQNKNFKGDDLLKKGMNAKIIKGPFAQLSGKIEYIDPDKRICILLNILGDETRVSVDRLSLTVISQFTDSSV